MNRYENIYREAAFMLKQGEARDRASALEIMLDTTKHLLALLGIQTLYDKKSPLIHAWIQVCLNETYQLIKRKEMLIFLVLEESM